MHSLAYRYCIGMSLFAYTARRVTQALDVAYIPACAKGSSQDCFHEGPFISVREYTIAITLLIYQLHAIRA